jgi:hypothetical protein
MLLHERSTTSFSGRVTFPDMVALVGYHLRVLNWWILLLSMGGFVLGGGMVWFALHSGSAFSPSSVAGLSRFLLETGAGTIAGILGSWLILGDPALELLLVRRQGIGGIVVWRVLLLVLLLLLFSTGFLAWSLVLGVQYGAHPTLAWFFFLWLAPVAFLGTMGWILALLMRNASLGTVFIGLSVACATVLKDFVLTHEWLRLFYIELTVYEPAAPDWWWNRLVLMSSALLLALASWWWLRSEERLLGVQA